MHDKFLPTLLLAYKVVDIMTLGTTPVLGIGGVRVNKALAVQ